MYKRQEIDYVFVCHTHIDHIGLIPRLIKEGFHGKIITSHATAQLMKPLLYNCVYILENEANILSSKFKRNYSPIYDESNVKESLKHIVEYDEIHKLYELDDVVSFKWLENSHCVGSRQLQLILKDQKDVYKRQLLLYSVGENWENDPTLNKEDGVIQCYTSRFNEGEFLCGIRNPHNSPNNICYLHNIYSMELKKYFKFSDNILAVNCIHTDIQDRANGCDFDSDFFFVTNNEVMVKSAKEAYKSFPTVVNKLNESGLTYQNTMKEYARMDNKFAKSRIGIGESSNLAQLAMTYYWTKKSKELYHNFVRLPDNLSLFQFRLSHIKRDINRLHTVRSHYSLVQPLFSWGIL